MKKSMTKKQIHDVYVIMNNARLNGLKRNEDKTGVLKILRELRPVATKYETDIKDAFEKLKPESYDENLNLARQFEQDRKTATMTAEEYEAFRKQFEEYQTTIRSTMEDEDKKEVEIEYNLLPSSAVEELMTINDWTVAQYFAVEELLC